MWAPLCLGLARDSIPICSPMSVALVKGFAKLPPGHRGEMKAISLFEDQMKGLGKKRGERVRERTEGKNIEREVFDTLFFLPHGQCAALLCCCAVCVCVYFSKN